jgi:hypothetical protein
VSIGGLKFKTSKLRETAKVAKVYAKGAKEEERKEKQRRNLCELCVFFASFVVNFSSYRQIKSNREVEKVE